MKNIHIFKYLIFCTALTIITGCVGLTERAGQFLDGSALNEKTIALYRTLEKNNAPANMEISILENKNSQQSIEITINNFPMMKLKGSFPDENNHFFLTSLEYLAGNTHGWNEFSLQLIGDGYLSVEETAILEKINEIEPIQITSGRIHRYDTRITDHSALTALRNRHDRITALTEWMLSLNGPKAQSLKNFEKHWKPILFPETTRRRNRPSGWQQDGDEFQRAEDINWNNGYTERHFSEELWPARNSGTLLRDWEEALPWIYMEYEWENIKNMFSNGISFTKIK